MRYIPWNFSLSLFLALALMSFSSRLSAVVSFWRKSLLSIVGTLSLLKLLIIGQQRFFDEKYSYFFRHNAWHFLSLLVLFYPLEILRWISEFSRINSRFLPYHDNSSEPLILSLTLLPNKPKKNYLTFSRKQWVILCEKLFCLLEVALQYQ